MAALSNLTASYHSSQGCIPASNGRYCVGIPAGTDVNFNGALTFELIGTLQLTFRFHLERV